MNTFKTFIVGVFALLMVALASAGVSAVAYGADPYDGVNRIGTYYQYTKTTAFAYEPTYALPATPAHGYTYDYIAPARAGGWFGSTTGWLTGVRTPVYTPVPPVHYTNYYQPVCGARCWYGGAYGYPRATASSFPATRERVGGVFSY